MNPDENLKPDVVGGHDLTSLRALFDEDDRNIIVASRRQLFYYSIDSCDETGRANISSSKLLADEKIVACERLNNTLYVATNYGKIFVWSLGTRDWMNELSLPLDEDEVLVSCKMLSKRQYIYTILNSTTNKITLNYSMSRSERERPKQKEAIGEITSGEQNTFDIGCIFDQAIEQPNRSPTKVSAHLKQRCLTFIHGSQVYFQQVGVGEKLILSLKKQRIGDLNFTCVRANPVKPMIAAGDSLGRIYLYTGNISDDSFNRTKLHWHTLPVSDTCFSSTGNTLFSVGGESGCVVLWDLTLNNLGQKRVVARLGMPIRHVSCSNILNQLVMSFEDNEIQLLDTNDQTKSLKTFTRRTIDMYEQNDYKALRIDSNNHETARYIGLLWHPQTNTVVTNGRTGWLQFYSPKTKSRTDSINFLKSKIFSLEKEARIIPSDITRATMTLDGDWLAFYETREFADSFPEVKLHIWQRSGVTSRWTWVQTADRLHSSTNIVDLKFSPDGLFLISVSDDGKFQVLHKIFLDPKADEKSKQMYTLGFSGNVPEKLPAMATFSQDSSVMAMSLKNDTTLIWMIVDPYKLVYECQLNQIETDVDTPTTEPDDNISLQPSHNVLGLHFGYHKPSQSLAPLCEVRSNSIRIWNILNSQETMEYSAADVSSDCQDCEFTAAAFDQCPGDSRSLDHFAVSTSTNMILIFRLQITQASKDLQPLMIVDGTLPFSKPMTPSVYKHMCFLGEPILEIDPHCNQEPELVRLINRLCLMNNNQELVSFTDKLTLEKQSATNSCNAIKEYDLNDLQAYFAKTVSNYREEISNPLVNSEKIDSNTITEKQRKIRKRLEVQKMLKDLLLRIPSQNLPKMDILGPMILDKLL